MFAADLGAATPDPVPFGETTALGLPAEEREGLEAEGLSIPRTQVFYSQYPHVVGYEGVERAVDTLAEPQHAQQFGTPLVIYVSDYDDTGVELTDDGHLRTETDPGWTAADEAWFVVDSGAELSTGETVVPFGSADGADAFAEEHDGEVLTWSELRSRSFDLDGATVVRDRVDRQHRSADDRVADARTLTERDPAVVVGEDADTIQEAVDTAPADSTVVVPEGTYDERVHVDRPITVRGENATVRGDGNGSVVRVTSDDVAITGLRVTGVGDSTRAIDERATAEDPADEDADDGDADDGESWDSHVEEGYGHSDAGIAATDASGTYVADVTIETPASGVLLRDAPDAVVERVAVNGTDQPMDGFMGVMAMRSPVVVQHSTFDGGRDGVYLHRSHDTVIRENTFRGNRFGVHAMYTSDSLIADNVARNQTSAGVTIMTSPARNAIVGNHVSGAQIGILPGGTRMYVADNVLVDNARGMGTGTTQSLYEHNVVCGNGVGVRSGSILPSNRVHANDFVGNDRHAVAGAGPLRVWTENGAGNYWAGAYGDATDGTLDRSYSPTDPVEAELHRTEGAVVLAESPAAGALAAIRSTTPGMRQGAIVDAAPLAEPANPDTLEGACGSTAVATHEPTAVDERTAGDEQ